MFYSDNAVQADAKGPRRPVGSSAVVSLRRRSCLLVLLLTILGGAAVCAAQTAAASGFPATESLDTFERASESPLSDGGKWSKLAWTKAIGRVFSATYGWTPSEGEAGASESEANGAFWNGRELASPAVSVHIYAESLKDYVAVWCDATGTSSVRTGYRLKVIGTGTSDTFRLLLEKWVSGTRTLLAESHEIAFKAASSENVVGLTALGGKVQAWYGTSEAGMVVESEASDTTFSRGYVGIEGTNKVAYGETKYRASGAAVFPATESLDTFERASESPLSDGGKWSRLGWAKTIGEVYSATYGWTPSEGQAGASESEASGAYWNGKEFATPAVSVHMYAEDLKDYVAVWSDATGSGSAKSGYRLRVVGTGSNYTFRLLLEKWVNGTRTLLAESHEVSFKGDSSENVIGVTAIGGKLDGWYGPTESGLAVVVEASDTTFSHGYVGIEGTNDTAYGETKYRAVQYETVVEREAKEKAEREAKERAEREAKEKAEREAKEKAEREKAEREAKERECRPVANPNTENNHCYVQITSATTEDEASIVDIESSLMNALPEGGRIDDEQWTGFSGSPAWVEAGETIGSIGYRPPGSSGGSGPHYVTSPVYFWAYFPDGVYPYTGAEEWDLGNGPALGNWFEATEVAEGGGGWCAKINNVQVGCDGGFPPYSSYTNAGMEVANIPPANLNSSNSGTVEMYQMNLKGEVFDPTAHFDTNLTGTHEWCYETPVDGHNYWLDFGTGPPPCAPGQEHTDVRAAEPETVAVAPHEVTAAPPNQGYEAPVGETLSEKDLRSAGVAISAAIGADPSPTSIEAVSTTLKDAASGMNPSFSAPGSTSPEMSRWWSSTADLLVVHGHFTLHAMPVVAQAKGAPSGSVLDVILDAHTGAVEATRIDERAPTSMSSLGPVVRLK